SRRRGKKNRYRLRERTRQYADHKLLDAGEEVVTRHRHKEWFVALVERAEPKLWGADHATWVGGLETDYDNVRAALEWCRQTDATTGLRLVASLWQFWVRR